MVINVKVDLHTHTNYSDGNLTLDEILKLAKVDNLDEIAITDHDTIINLSNYKELQKEYDINIIPGIEIPTDVRMLHILGYGIEDFNLIENEMLKLKKYNEKLNQLTIETLRKNGMDISFEKVKKQSKLDVVTYRDIVNYIYNSGLVNDPHDAYRKYIGKGTTAYYPSINLSVENVIKLIKSSKGFSVLAHPFTIDKKIDLEQLICNLTSYGLEGIEIYPPSLTSVEVSQYNYLASKYNLIKTIGTDFHNSNYQNLGVEIEEEYLEKFHRRVYKKK